jgi:hypothetical protein
LRGDLTQFLAEHGRCFNFEVSARVSVLHFGNRMVVTSVIALAARTHSVLASIALEPFREARRMAAGTSPSGGERALIRLSLAARDGKR